MSAPVEVDLAGAASRRDFLTGLAALGVGGWALGACSRGTSAGAGSAAAAMAAHPTRPTADRIGVQLYTVGDQLRQDFEGTVEKVAQVGYKQVEFAGYYNRTPEMVLALLYRIGLTAPSTHKGLEKLLSVLQRKCRLY